MRKSSTDCHLKRSLRAQIASEDDGWLSSARTAENALTEWLRTLRSSLAATAASLDKEAGDIERLLRGGGGGGGGGNDGDIDDAGTVDGEQGTQRADAAARASDLAGTLKKERARLKSLVCVHSVGAWGKGRKGEGAEGERAHGSYGAWVHGGNLNKIRRDESSGHIFALSLLKIMSKF